MPTRDTAPTGAPCWIDLLSSDTDRSREFYGALFGWTAEQGGEEYGGYINFFRNGAQTAGMMGRSPEMSDAPDGWTVYLSTPDAEVTTKAAEANGGMVLVPPMDILTLGRMGIVGDSGGAVVGLWQPGDFPGFSVLAEPGAPGWFELHTRDYDATVDFYRTAFGWETHAMSDSPEFRYATLFEGEAAAAGIMDASAFLPEGVPAHWSVYFSVEDTDEALRRTTELGGAVVMPAEDTPYGRLATATDPLGAMFKLMS
jgi:predicted enzyme related to lactoylglutathione lyase